MYDFFESLKLLVLAAGTRALYEVRRGCHDQLTGEEEASGIGGIPGARLEKGEKGTLVEVPQPRRFYRLTRKGRAASEIKWQDPLQALYAYPKEVRSPRPTRYRRPGTLPRTKKP